MAKNDEKMTYEQAYEELQTIVEQIEEGDIGVDDLAAKVKRASVLISFCKKKLKSVEEDVNGVLGDMKD